MSRAKKHEEAVLHCSFCGLNQHEVSVLVAGPKANICNECIRVSAEVVADQFILAARNAEQVFLPEMGFGG